MADLIRPRYIILHCSATPDGPAKSWDAIKRYHVVDNGWSAIGYHFGVEEIDGGYYLLPGRGTHLQGAHCRAAGRNRDSLGVCVVGAFDAAPPSPFLVRYVVDALTVLAFAHNIPVENIRGHREFESRKTCPGLLWPLDLTRDQVAQRLRDDSPIRRHLRADLLRMP